ncbi:ATP-binding protein [Streptomyces beijiangensis]|uniref:AAA family ATPase n=1 Tax=Streptomyces beijiangensis TaxID=163361 RepID=A0A939F4U5_9ACTN|nr:AAA family ATPase [Streptomyces beijiangensis]MBO0511047.1 AAA family ATPase [Streptomyces beijiangensis]
MRIQLLGGFRVERADSVPVAQTWRRSSAKTLVKLLAVAPGRTLHRERVMDVLWPDAGTDAALRNLRVTLHAARHALEPELAPRATSSYLLADAEMLRLAPGRVRVDTDETQEAARAALASGDLPALEAARTALEEELLPEDRYADWAETHRRTLRSLHDRLTPALAAGLLAAGRPDDAVRMLRSAVDRSPTDEPLQLLLARTLLDTGRPRQAIQQYHACREALSEELGVRPGAAFEQLHRAALASITPRHPAVSVPGPTPLPSAIRRHSPLPLFGREHPLALLVAHSTNTDGSPLVLVRGEPGIGKTRLAEETARDAARRGASVVWGTSHEAEGHTPYGVFADALGGHLAGCTAEEVAVIGAEHPGLAYLLPVLGAEPVATGSPEEERARLFRAVSGLLTDMAAVRPVLIVLDDLHTADPGSLALLHHLVRTAHPRRWRFIATCREETLPPGSVWGEVRDTFVGQRMAVEIDLLRLSRADCVGLAARATGSSRAAARGVASRIFELSLGNPLFALELTTGAYEDLERTTGPRGSGTPDSIAVPENIRRVVGGRLNRLPPDARRALAALSVADRGAVSLSEFEPVAAAGLHPPMAGPAVVAALDAALAAGIVEEREVVVGGRPSAGYAFKHPLVRLACAEQLSSAARGHLHRAFADAVLRTRPEAVDTIAFHLSHADDVRAPEYLHRAARRAAALYANDSACGYYEDLVARLDAAGDPFAAGARLEWGIVLRHSARYTEAEAVLGRALRELTAAGEEAGALRATVSLGETLGRAGRPLEGLAVLSGASEVRGSSDRAGEGRASLHLAIASLRFSAGLVPGALAALGTVQKEAAGLPEDLRLPLLSQMFSVRAACLVVTGQLRESRTVAEQALSIAEQTGDAALQSGALSVVGELARKDGRPEAARDCARRAVTIARRTGDPSVLAFDQSNLAGAELLLGEHRRATALVETAVRLARSLGRTWCLPYALITLAEVRLRNGRLDEARSALSECTLVVGASGDPQLREGLRRLSEELGEARAASAR